MQSKLKAQIEKTFQVTEGDDDKSQEAPMTTTRRRSQRVRNQRNESNTKTVTKRKRRRREAVDDDDSERIVDDKSVSASEQSDNNNDNNDDEMNKRNFVLGRPYHVDLSASKAFYPMIQLLVNEDRYDTPYNKRTQMMNNVIMSSSASMKKAQYWSVRLGDTVVIHADVQNPRRKLKAFSSVVGRAQHKSTAFSSFDTHPFRCPWWMGEVTAIFRKMNDNHDDETIAAGGTFWENDDDSISTAGTKSNMLSRKSITTNKTFGEFIIEIRWFYQKGDIPGVATQTKKNENSSSYEIDEIFESDDMGEIPADSLLGHICLHSDPSNVKAPITSEKKATEEEGEMAVVDMPIVHFYCHRHWSVHRKSLMPIGTSQNRIHRGMMYSNYHGKQQDVTIKESALNSIIALNDNGISQDFSKKKRASLGHHDNWKLKFDESIHKLSLTEASAVVTMDKGVLMGREKEQLQITTFLRSAILGANPDNNNSNNNNNNNNNNKTKMKISNNKADTEEQMAASFSLFIAGPPGTGKTACVRSIVSNLHKEESKGKIPSFKFVSLNGMEMRRPFDAYVRLWEAVSPDKEMRSAEVAAGLLETYFGGMHLSRNSSKQKDPKNKSNSDHNNYTTKRSITVVLLDEIDFLVTKKQTVLYNFFDWPIRGFAGNSKSQLIVIGISNTLNLPDRLMPKVQSRLGAERCIFKAYNVDESIKILNRRLGITTEPISPSIFHPDAIKFIARKVATDSGDIRKAFRLCKAAAETVLDNLETGQIEISSLPNNIPGGKGSSWVRISDVQKASREMFGTVQHKAIFHSTAFEALLLVTLAVLTRDSGRDQGGFEIDDILHRMDSLASALGDDRYLPAPSFSELLGIISRLGESRVITVQTPNGAHQNYGVTGASSTRVTLQLEDYELLAAFKDTQHTGLANKNLANSNFF